MFQSVISIYYQLMEQQDLLNPLNELQFSQFLPRLINMQVTAEEVSTIIYYAWKATALLTCFLYLV